MTNTTVVERSVRTAISEWSAEYLALVKAMVLTPKHREATNAELALFAEQCKRTGLDPIADQIYGIYRKNNQRGGAEELTIQVSIDGLRLQAERTGKYQGQTPVEWCGKDKQWTDVWLEDEPPAAARAGVWKVGHDKPTLAVATWREFRQTGPMWQKIPAHMLGKVAEALALRRAFPAETSGLMTPEETGIAPFAAVIDSQRPAQAPAGGTVTLPASAVTEPPAQPVPAVTADPPEPTEEASTAAQRRKVWAECKKAEVGEKALKRLLVLIAGTPHSDRLPKSKVDDMLHAIHACGASGLAGEDLERLLHALPDDIDGQGILDALGDPDGFYATQAEGAAA
jgi:phage recombination protein Bet